MEEEVIARLSPSPARRVFAAAVQGALGAGLLWVALAHPPAAAGWRLFLLCAGVWGIGSGLWLWRATAAGIELTAQVLREAGSGRVLARMADVQRVSRGAFAIKPSNGFVLTLATPAPAVWAPGLWWRIGRRVGVGGVTARHQTRAMAEAIAARLDV